MSRLIDPSICPDCRAPLDPTSTCTACGLHLSGPLAHDLWHAMTTADGLVERLRTSTGPVASAYAVPQGQAATFVDGLPAAPPVVPLPAGRRALPSASGPVIVLALGALCLLVAAVVFVAVAWSDLGLGAKTAILLGLTALLAATEGAVTKRGLRGAAETFALVVAGMLTVDLAAAHAADLAGLGSLSLRVMVGLVGLALLGQGVGVAAWATVLPIRRVEAAEGLAVLGTFLAALGFGWVAPHPAAATAVALPLLAALALALQRPLPRVAYGVAGVATLSWLVLMGEGLDAMSRVPTDRLWWNGFEGWMFLVAAAYALAVAVFATPHRLRVGAAASVLVALSLLAAGPSGSATADLVTGAVIVLVWAGLSVAAPRVCGQAAGFLTAAGLVAFAGGLLIRPLPTLGLLPGTADATRLGLGLRVPPPADLPLAWTAVLMAVVTVAALLGLVRHVPTQWRDTALRTAGTLTPGVLALGVATAMLELEPTVTLAATLFLLALVVTAVATAVERERLPVFAAGIVLAGYLLLVMLRVAVASHLLAAALATLVAIGVAAAYALVERDLHQRLAAAGLAAAAVLMAGFAALHWPYVAHLGLDTRALVVTGVAVGAGLVAGVVSRSEQSRVAVEVAALVVAAVALALPLHDTVVAMVATAVGTAIAVVAATYDDRAWASWLGVAVLGSATVMRVVLDVRAPELYTLPAAALLLVAGVLRIRRDPGVTSATALGSGLTLALAPSLLLALDEPVSLRGALIVLGGLIALAVGIGRHWSAPLVAGALTVGLLAVRHLGPVAEAIPRWVSFGMVGIALLVIGVTWESRRRDLEAAGAYLAELR